MPVLTKTEIETFLKTASDWKIDGGKLVRNWSFRNFADAMIFVNRVAVLAESSNHHPDIDIRYNQVQLGLISHDAGGITDRDRRMAEALDREFD